MYSCSIFETLKITTLILFQELDVMFSAIYTPSLKEYVHIEGEQGGTPSGIVRNGDFFKM